MKHLAVALIVLGLLAADWLADYYRMPHAHAWSGADTFGLIFVGFWFFHHRDRHGPFA